MALLSLFIPRWPWPKLEYSTIWCQERSRGTGRRRCSSRWGEVVEVGRVGEGLKKGGGGEGGQKVRGRMVWRWRWCRLHGMLEWGQEDDGRG